MIRKDPRRQDKCGAQLWCPAALPSITLADRQAQEQICVCETEGHTCFEPGNARATTESQEIAEWLPAVQGKESESKHLEPTAVRPQPLCLPSDQAFRRSATKRGRSVAVVTVIASLASTVNPLRSRPVNVELIKVSVRALRRPRPQTPSPITITIPIPTTLTS